MIGIIDYGMGNTLSVKNAVEYLGHEIELVSTPDGIKEYEKLILPGVGAFQKCIENLKKKGFLAPIREAVNEQKTPILGICLGMQVMATLGYEGGSTEGLGFFDAEVTLISHEDQGVRVPHIGWSEVNFNENALFSQLKQKTEFYFVHSYYMKCKNRENVIATAHYGELEVTAAVGQGHIFGTQFHPEKSSVRGLKVLENFLNFEMSPS